MVHEWALAESIILYVLNQGVKNARRLIVKIGALQSIDKEILDFSIRELAKLSELDIEEIEIVVEAPQLRCNSCSYTWSIDISQLDDDVREAIHFLPESIYAYIRCPRCNSIDFEIVRGRGLTEIVVERFE